MLELFSNLEVIIAVTATLLFLVSIIIKTGGAR